MGEVFTFLGFLFAVGLGFVFNLARLGILEDLKLGREGRLDLLNMDAIGLGRFLFVFLDSFQTYFLEDLLLFHQKHQIRLNI
jgi:hypothetical protein